MKIRMGMSVGENTKRSLCCCVYPLCFPLFYTHVTYCVNQAAFSRCFSFCLCFWFAACNGRAHFAVKSLTRLLLLLLMLILQQQATAESATSKREWYVQRVLWATISVAQTALDDHSWFSRLYFFLINFNN